MGYGPHWDEDLPAFSPEPFLEWSPRKPHTRFDGKKPEPPPKRRQEPVFIPDRITPFLVTEEHFERGYPGHLNSVGELRVGAEYLVRKRGVETPIAVIFPLGRLQDDTITTDPKDSRLVRRQDCFFARYQLLNAEGTPHDKYYDIFLALFDYGLASNNRGMRNAEQWLMKKPQKLP